MSQIIEQTDQHPDAEQGNYQRRAHVFAGEHYVEAFEIVHKMICGYQRRTTPARDVLEW
jgi:hypothetical protein